MYDYHTYECTFHSCKDHFLLMLYSLKIRVPELSLSLNFKFCSTSFCYPFSLFFTISLAAARREEPVEELPRLRRHLGGAAPSSPSQALQALASSASERAQGETDPLPPPPTPSQFLN